MSNLGLRNKIYTYQCIDKLIDLAHEGEGLNLRQTQSSGNVSQFVIIESSNKAIVLKDNSPEEGSTYNQKNNYSKDKYIYKSNSETIYEFLTENKLKETLTINSHYKIGENQTEIQTETYEVIRLFIKGVETVTSYKVNGETKPYTKRSKVKASFDPFETKYTLTTLRHEPTYEGNLTYEQTCLYEDTDVKTFYELYPSAIIGKWTLQQDPNEFVFENEEVEDKHVSFNKDFSFAGNISASEFGTYHIEKDQLILQGKVTSAYQIQFYNKYKMSLNGKIYTRPKLKSKKPAFLK